MICINLFGGPGSGKSVVGSDVFANMKKMGYSVEMVHEYAKDLTYAEDFNRLKDQLKILGEQHHRQWILRDKVDYCINDGPFLLGLVYYNDGLPEKKFKKFVVDLYNSYNNINIFINRPDSYEEYGRTQDISEAIEIDNKIKAVFDKYDIPYLEFSCFKAAEEILELLDQ